MQCLGFDGRPRHIHWAIVAAQNHLIVPYDLDYHDQKELTLVQLFVKNFSFLKALSD